MGIFLYGVACAVIGATGSWIVTRHLYIEMFEEILASRAEHSPILRRKIN